MNDLATTSRPRFLAGLAAAAGAIGAGRSSSAQAATLQPIRIGTIPGDFGAEPYYGNDLGIFAKHGLIAQITTMNNGPAIGAAVAGGALDAGFLNVPSLVIAHQHGVPFTLLAGANLYEAATPTIGLLSVRRDSKIKTATDFSGKIVAIGGINNIVHIGARAWIDANGGDSNAVRWIEFPHTEMPADLLAGRIDGAILDQGVYPTLGKVGDPIRVVAATLTAIAPNFTSAGWFCMQDFITKHPVETRNFVAAMYETARWANDRRHHQTSANILARTMKTSVAEINASTRVVYSTNLTSPMIQPLIDVVARYKLIPAPYAASDILSSYAASG
jgi:NitT/TauT family transport system substrate-binding protein